MDFLKGTEENELKNQMIVHVKEQGISYYIYDNEDDLFDRIKKSVMSIARDISINNATKYKYSDKECAKIAMNHDYEMALGFISIVNCMKRDEITDIVYTDFVDAFTGNGNDYLRRNKYCFTDTKMYDLLLDAYGVAKEFTDKHAVETTIEGPVIKVYECPYYGKVEIRKCSDYHGDANRDREWYNKKLAEFYLKFSEFVKYIETKKIMVDADIPG